MDRLPAVLALTFTLLLFSGTATQAAPFTAGVPGSLTALTEYGDYGFEGELLIGAGYSLSQTSAVGMLIFPRRSPIVWGAYTTKSLGPLASNTELFYASGKLFGTTTAQYLVDLNWLKLSGGVGAYYNKDAPSGKTANYFLTGGANLAIGRNLNIYGRLNYWLSFDPDSSYDLGIAFSY
ncbi:MAG: hypothetical protein K6U80_14905 [Firmicutes bacterium]|nr:hypothetical protein [Bacillota bacterium]